MAGLIFEFLWRAYSLRRGRAHTIRAKTMKQYWINLQEYLALCKYMPTLLRAAKSAHELPVKSVVVCSTDNFESLQQLGVVLQAGDEVNLVAPSEHEKHEDGEKGEVFVVPFNKARMPKKADPGLATIVFVHSLHTHTHTHYYTTILLLLDTAKPGWWSSNEVRQLCVSTTKIAEGLWVTNVTYLGNSPDYKSCVWDNWTCTITGITPPRHVICTHDMITRTHDMYP